MISAAEARNVAMVSISEKDLEMLGKIESAVTRVSKNGLCKCLVNGWASEKVKLELQSLGYKIKNHSDQRDGDFVEIEWWSVNEA